MRARTIHSTCGSVSSNFGRLLPHPPLGFELSTGTPRGSDCRAGVADPGVDGGVNAGERSDCGGNGRVFNLKDDGTDDATETASSLSSPYCARPGFDGLLVAGSDRESAERSTGGTSPELTSGSALAFVGGE